MQLRAFLASPLGPKAKPVMGNDYILYFALPDTRLGDRDFAISLIFDARTEQLKLLMLYLLNGRLDETERNAVHKRWLRKELPGIRARPDGERRFPWGTIDARWVPQNDESYIIVSYGQGLKDVIGRPGAGSG